MIDRATERSAFCTRRGLFAFTRMPCGLSRAPACFCRLMSIVLRDILWQICLCYLDNIILFAKTPQELLDRLHQVFMRLAEVGLKVKPSKTVLFKTEIEFIWHLVTAQGGNPLPNKLKAIRDYGALFARCSSLLWLCVLLSTLCSQLCNHCQTANTVNKKEQHSFQMDG